MTANPTTVRSIPEVVLGLGSWNGDDKFGWSVIDELVLANVDAELRKIRHPVDVLPWLEIGTHIHVVDAAMGLPREFTFRNLDFGDPSDRAVIKDIPTHGTHDIGLYLTLMMAKSLGKPTEHVTLWLGQAERFDPMSPISLKTQGSLQACAEELIRRLCHARYEK